LNALGVSDYGLYSVVASIVFLMAFLNNIMITTTYRFIAFEEGTGDKDSVNKVFNISLVIHILIAFSVLIIAETFGVYYINNYLIVDPQKLNEALFVFRVSIYTTIISILGVPYQGLLVAKEKFIISSFIEITRSLLQLGVVVLVLYYSGSKLKLYSLLVGITSMVPPVLFFLYTRYKYKAIVRWRFQKNRGKYKEMAFFSGWTMLGAAAVASELQFSILLINMFFGTIVNAGFAVAVSVNSIVRTFSQSLNQSVIPQITKSYSAGETERTMDLVVFTSKYSFFLILFPSIPLLLETDVILKLWLNNVPVGTSLFVKLFIISAIISSMYAGIPAIVQATGKIKYFQIILSSLSLIGIPISYFLFKTRIELKQYFANSLSGLKKDGIFIIEELIGLNPENLI
jgi:O-antigen/teichoic acid export membrane protein